MVDQSLSVLQVSTSDIGGGAEKIAWDLFQAYRVRGFKSHLAVGTKYSNDVDVHLMRLVPSSVHSNIWTYGWLNIADQFSAVVGKVRGAWKARNLLRMIARPQLLLDSRRGYEDFDFPGSWNILDLQDKPPDIVHCHNLHGGYFDLRSLSQLSQRVPTVFTLHDMWMLSGHCAYSFECQRWKIGCGSCPDLTIYPAIRRDATSFNWQRKQEIYSQSHIHIATPSQWLMSKVEQSMLYLAIADKKVIPNGVDLTVFHPDNRQKARSELGIPLDAKLLLHVGYSTKSNLRRDYEMLEATVKSVAERLPNQKIILICLGEEQETERVGQAEIRFIGYQKDAQAVAQYYQAADIYLHPAKVDTFPTVVLEALACGTPVVATAVGGIPEQVRDGETGFLVAPKDVDAMVKHALRLLTDDMLFHQFGQSAANSARERFDLNRQVDEYLEWYHAIVERNKLKV